MNPAENPFSHDQDRADLWDMLVRRNVSAFVGSDWSLIADDYDQEHFMGVNANRSVDPDGWTLAFPSVSAFRSEWLRLADEIGEHTYLEPVAPAILRATDLSKIDICGDLATASKHYDGVIRRADGRGYELNWRTQYFCRRFAMGWKIVGLISYLGQR